jgi:hypothetical protein
VLADDLPSEPEEVVRLSELADSRAIPGIEDLVGTEWPRGDVFPVDHRDVRAAPGKVQGGCASRGPGTEDDRMHRHIFHGPRD